MTTLTARDIAADVPSLVEVDDEDDVVTETRKSVSGWHGDDECKHVVNERVERLTQAHTQTHRHTHTHRHTQLHSYQLVKVT